MSRKNPIDLRSISLGATNVASFALKRDATAFAKACGWSPKNVQWAYNRFSMFFIVSEQQGIDAGARRRILTRDKNWIDLPLAAD